LVLQRQQPPSLPASARRLPLPPRLPPLQRLPRPPLEGSRLAPHQLHLQARNSPPPNRVGTISNRVILTLK